MKLKSERVQQERGVVEAIHDEVGSLDLIGIVDKGRGGVGG